MISLWCFYHWDIFPLLSLSSPLIPKAWKWHFFSENLLIYWCRVSGKPKFLIWSNSRWEFIEYSTYFSFQPFFTALRLQICNLSAIIRLHYDYPMITVGLITLSGECWCAPINGMFRLVWKANYCVLHLLRKSFSMKRQSKTVSLGTICFLSVINMFRIVWLLWSVYHKLNYYAQSYFWDMQ